MNAQTRIHGQRKPRVTLRGIHPHMLLQKYRDPELALAAAVIQLTALDIMHNTKRADCFEFLDSDWFAVIARGLKFQPETLRALEIS